ncbi:MAG: hypothetical protein MUD15_04255 [Desulfobacterota bacterium]|jgi:hypothetical protein|nr:hypothetical protein [Thermodesulfobacteriota bacterium]
MGKMVSGVLALMVFAVCFNMPAYAEDGTDSAWRVSVAPFIWFIGIEGTANVKGRSADVNMNFSDILSNLDMVGEINIEAGTDKYGVFVQPNYLDMSDEVTSTLPISGAQVKSTITCTTTFIEFGGFSRLVDVRRETGGHNTIDLLGGLRYWDMTNEVKLSVPTAGVDRTVKADTNLLDPFVGLRMKAYIADKVPYSLRADIGGLNTGSSSSFTYNLQALLGYDFTQSITMFGGYRVLYVDFGDSQAGADIKLHGPALGVNITF